MRIISKTNLNTVLGVSLTALLLVGCGSGGDDKKAADTTGKAAETTGTSTGDTALKGAITVDGSSTVYPIVSLMG